MNAVLTIEDLNSVIDDRTLEILSRRRTSRRLRRRGWLVTRALLAADVVGFAGAFVAAEYVVFWHKSDLGALTQLNELIAFLVSLPVWVVAAKLYHLYDQDEERTHHSTADEFAALFHLVTVCTFLLYAASRATKWFSPDFSKLFAFWVIAIVGVALLRAGVRGLCRRHIIYLQNTAIVGAGETGQSLARKLIQHPEYGLNLVGFIDSDPKDLDRELEHLAILGGLENLEDVVELLDVERVIFAFTADGHAPLLSAISDLRSKDVQIDIVPRLYDKLGPSIGIHPIEGIPLVSLPPARLPRSSMLIKRALDLAGALIGLIVLSPLILAVALAIKIDSRGPVFYLHERVGRRSRAMRLIKFRTMYRELCRGDAYGGDEAEDAFQALMNNPALKSEFQRTYKLREDPRVTRIGRVLRRTSIDELPQLWNVLRGDLSLVGPRALTSEELNYYYGPAADELLEIRPGVTGYWQVNGRSDLAYADRVRLDLAYVGGWSLALDLGILARTLRVLLSRVGAT